MNVLNKYTSTLFLVISVLSHNAVNADKMGSRCPIGQLSKALKKENLQKVLSGAAWLWSSLGRDTVSYDQGSTTGGNYDYVDPGEEESDEGNDSNQAPSSGSGSSQGGSGNGGGKKPNQEQDPIIYLSPLSEEYQAELNHDLIEAVSGEQWERVQELMRSGARVNAVNSKGESALHIAVYRGHEAIVNTLLFYDPNVMTVDRDRRTALHLAAYRGHEAIVNILLAYYPNVMAVDRDGRTALDIAKLFRQDPIVSLLQARQESISAFPSQAGSVRPRSVDLSGVQDTDQERRGQRIRASVVETDVVMEEDSIADEIASFMTDTSMDCFTNWNGLVTLNQLEREAVNRQLINAILCNDIHEVIQSIRIARADAEAYDDCGYSPLTLAASKGYLSIVRYLIDCASVNIEAADVYGRTSIQVAASNGHLSIVRYLIEEIRVDANETNAGEPTLLTLAASNGHLSIVRYLIEEIDVDANETNARERTLLQEAASNGHLSIVRYLIEEIRVDANKSHGKWGTPLQVAASEKRWDIVEYLIFKGAIVTSEIIDMIVIDGNVAIIETMMKAEFERRGKKDAQKILMRYMVLNLCLDKMRKPKDDY